MAPRPQGHQLFIIAKLKGQHYRSLAAAHHQWLEGVSTLSTCYRLLQIFSDQANRYSIQQELTFAAEFYGATSETEIEALVRFQRSYVAPRAPCPFPFITTCLMVGASCNPDVGRCYSLQEEDFGIRYNHRHRNNTNGITILDITDLSNVRYCFVNICGIDSELERELPLHTPLDGWTYVRAYHDDGDDIVLRNKAAIDGLENYGLVELAALADCWPDSAWSTTAAAAAGAGDPDNGLPLAVSNEASVPSLRSLSQNKLFQELLSSDTPADLTLLNDPMEYFRGFTSDLRHYLTEHADALDKSPVAVDILKKAFEGEKHFDFIPFIRPLAEDQLVALGSSKALRELKTANLSGIDSCFEAGPTVAAIVEHLKLDSLYLLTHPDRRIEDPSEMAQAIAKCSNHPLVSQRLVLGSAFSRSLRPISSDTWIPAALDAGYWKTFPVMQLLYHGPTEFKGSRAGRQNGPWLSGFFLGDALLTPVRFVTGLLNVIKGRFKEPRQVGPSRGQLDVPLSFACAASTLKTFTSSFEVSPIPAEAILSAISEYNSYPKKGPTGSIRDLDPEGWTAVLVHTTPMDPWTLRQVPGAARFRVALVRSKGRPVPLRDSTIDPDELEVVDLRVFLELVAPEHASDLEACLSELTAWAQTDDELVGRLTVDEVVTTLQAFVDEADSADPEVDLVSSD